MGSFANGQEDDAAERHQSRRPVPSPSPSHRQHHWRRTTPETFVNGTAWYNSPPSPRRFPSDLQAPIASPARYELSPSVRFNDGTANGYSAVSRHRYNGYFNDKAFGFAGVRPQANGVPPSMAYNRMPDYVYGAPSGGFSAGLPYPGSTCGSVPGYTCNVQQNQRTQYLPCDGHARPYVQRANPVHVSFPDPCVSQDSSRLSSFGRLMLEQTWHSLPPHAIRTAGKTLRQVVTWCGMTMPVTVTSQAAAMVEWIQRQAGELFGFDLEWKPNRCKDEDNEVAILQICGPTDCLIIQLLYTDTIPKMLREFLSNAEKQLGGVGIRQDVAKLERDHELVCQGQVELGVLASEKLQRSELRGTGLKMLVYQVLGMTLVKVKRITLSNWEKEDLDQRQIEYACIDAWAAYAVFHKLMTL